MMITTPPSLPRRARLLLLALMMPLTSLRAEEAPPAQNSPREILRDALYAEEVTRDAGKAAESYAKVIELYKAQQPFAATALFRLAEVRRKQGNKEEAIKLYQQLLREFPAAEVEGKLARENLAALGAAEVAGPATVVVDEEAQELRRIQEMAKNTPDLVKDPKLAEGAVERGQAQVLEYLISSGLEKNPGRLLSKAAETGQVKIVQMLASRAKDSSDAGEALWIAISKRYLQVARVLVEGGVGVNAQSYDSYRLKDTPEDPYPNSARNFPEDAGKVSPLHLALRRGDIEIVRLLLDHGAHPNAMAEGPADLGSPLHEAARQGNLEAVKLLLGKGADPNLAVPGTGVTPLHLAARSSSSETADALLQAGAKLEARTSEGETPLMSAAAGGDSAPLELLLQKGADPDGKAANGTPVLGFAVRSGNAKVVRLLLDHKADPKVRFGKLTLARDAGHDDPFFSGTESETLTDYSLLFAAAGNQHGNSRLPIISMLLEAGCSCGPELSQVIDLVARNDEKGEVVRALAAQHHGPVNLEELPTMSSWMPAAKTAYLETVIYRELAKRGGASLIRLFEAIKPVELLPPTGAAPSTLSLAKLLLSNPNYLRANSGSSGRLALTLIRKTGQDADASWTRTALDPNAEAPFPDLLPGDIVELNYLQDGSNQGPDPSKALSWDLRKRVKFPVTLEIDGGAPRELTLRGDLVVHDLRHPNQVPWIGTASLVQAFTDYEKGEAEITVQRKGWPDIQVNRYPGADHKDFELEAGDKVVVRWKAYPDRDGEARKKRVEIRAEGLDWKRVYSDTVFSQEEQREKSAGGASLPTLVQALVDMDATSGAPGLNFSGPDYSGSGNKSETVSAWLQRTAYLPITLFPFPDYSRIRIRRLQEDGSERVIPVDLSTAVAAAAQGSLTVEQARAADQPLQAGDVVEIPTRQDKLNETWKGWSEAEAAFFAKALDCRVQITDRSGIVSLKEVHYRAPRYVNWGVNWIPAAPLAGTSSLNASSALLTGQNYYSNEFELTRAGSTSPRISPENAYIREGDAVKLLSQRVVAPPSPQPSPRPTVTPPRPRR